MYVHITGNAVGKKLAYNRGWVYNVSAEEGKKVIDSEVGKEVKESDFESLKKKGVKFFIEKPTKKVGSKKVETR